MSQRLTPDQVAAFERDGYLLPEQPVLPEDEFAAFRDHTDQLLERWERGTSRRPESLDTPHFFDPELLRWVAHPQVLDLVEPLVGPDIALFSTHFICKPPGTGQRVPWHEDSAYWKGLLEPMDVVTLWLAVDPATPANGCMRVIPGSHRGGYSEYAPVDDAQTSVFGTEIVPESVDAERAVDCVLAPNRCSFHHAKCIHGSEPNTGDQRRCGLTMRFIASSAVYHPDARPHHAAHQMYLLRGEDRSGSCRGVIGEPNRAWLAEHPELARTAEAYASA